MRRSPGLTAAALLTLALGIGATSAAFSVVHALLLKPLPLREPGRLLYLMGSTPEQRGAGIPLSLVAIERFQEQNRSFAGVAAFCRERLTLTGLGDPEQLSAARVSENFFDVLETQPLLGRVFQASDVDEPVAVISYSLWQRRFGGEPGIVGKSVTLGQESYSVAGVMPAEFPFPFAGTDVWVSRLLHYSGFPPEMIRNGAGYLAGIVRLKPGVPVAQGQAEISQLYSRYQRDFPGHPDANPKNRLEAAPLQVALVSDIRERILLLMGVVGFVLSIACANVASLLLAKATGRTREIAVRGALGANRGDLVRQLLAESVVLSMAGAALGLWLAIWGVALFEKANAAALPGFQPIRVDATAFAFTLLVSLVAGVAFGLVPALQMSRPDLQTVLREGAAGLTASGRARRVRSVLVCGQIALSVVLLIGTSLLIESFRRLQGVELGFVSQQALTLRVALPPAKYPDDVRRSQFLREVIGRLRELPGVESASASLALPIGTALVAPMLPEGEPDRPIPQRPLATWNPVMPGYFQTLGIPLKRGRDFTARDDESGPKKIIVSESVVRRFWPTQDPIGKRITYARRQIVAEVVGVVGDVHTRGLETDPGLIFYTPYPQFSWPGVSFTVRVAGDVPAVSLVQSARAQIFAVDRDLPVTQAETLDQVVEEAFAERRTTLYAVGGFAGLALVLTLVGLYGVMAWTVAQRTAEFGLRQALGAKPGDIRRLVLSDSARLAVTGIVMGVVAAAVLTRLMAQMLYRVSATDPGTFVGIAALFLVVALGAGYLPARRAMRIDPIAALRGE